MHESESLWLHPEGLQTHTLREPLLPLFPIIVLNLTEFTLTILGHFDG